MVINSGSRFFWAFLKWKTSVGFELSFFFFCPLFVVFVICPLSFTSLDESGLRRWFKVVSVGDWFGFRSLSEAGVRAQTLVIHSQSRRAVVTLPFPLVWVRSEVTCAIVL